MVKVHTEQEQQGPVATPAQLKQARDIRAKVQARSHPRQRLFRLFRNSKDNTFIYDVLKQLREATEVQDLDLQLFQQGR